ncbi:MAG: acyl carrier protein [Colwellia sp.]|nr:acyl carrier protein [Colwellia sp.]
MSNLENIVKEIIVEVLKISADKVYKSLNSDTIPEWDSMGHMQIIIKLESFFSCDIPHNEVAMMTSEEGIIKVLSNIVSDDFL